MRPVWQIFHPYRFGLQRYPIIPANIIHPYRFGLQRYPITPANIIHPFANLSINSVPNYTTCCSANHMGSYYIAHDNFNSNSQMIMDDESAIMSSNEISKNNETRKTKRTLNIGETCDSIECSDSTLLSRQINNHCKVVRREGQKECFSTVLSNCFGRSSNFTQSMHFHTSSNPPKLELDEMSADKQKDNAEIEMMSERMLGLRHWQVVGKSEPSEDCLEFSLMSYNVLAQSLLEGNQYLYSHCSPEILSWSYRQEKLFNELLNSNTDIFCLQEVEENHYKNNFKPFFEEEGFSSIYKKRTGNKNDGCAIFYRTSVFQLENWVAVEYNKPGVWVLDRDNIGIVALFRPLKKANSTCRICVATTHLLFNPRRGDVKLAQLQVLLAEIDNLAFKRTNSSGKPLYHPVILCGDMNSEPYCEIYNFLTTGTINYTGLPIATMSGQSEGNWYRNRRQLSSELLPAWLGITDQCQFFKKFSERHQSEVSETSDEMVNSPTESINSSESNFACCKSSIGQESLNPVCNAESKEREENTLETSERSPCAFTPAQLKKMFSSGQMLHNLKLISVYKHDLDRLPGEREVTTQHSNASCTVDYIFYSVKKKLSSVQNSKVKHQNVKENNLKLLAYYGLLSGREVRCFGGLPNAISPSDHLPLIAKFSLKL